jgi:dihydrolipoamide dehydrogenase
MTLRTWDVAVIGGGPGGYSAALRCAEHGLNTVLIERAQLGGTCLNIGCIPSKAVIHAANTFADIATGRLDGLGIAVAEPRLELSQLMTWTTGVVDKLRTGVSNLLSGVDVEVVRGHAEVVDANNLIAHGVDGTQRTITAKNVVIATGSRPAELDVLPFGGTTISSDEVFRLERLPERLVVVGAGYIGLELGTAIRKLGAAVTVVEVADRVLPQFDRQLTRPVETRLRELGIELMTAGTVEGASGHGVNVRLEAGGNAQLPADLILVTVGRAPVTDGLGLDRLGLASRGRFLAIDDCCQTSMRGVFAVGDISGEPMLAHRAIAQAHIAGDVIAGKERTWDHRAIPAVCFTDPEIFSVGLDSSDVAGRADVFTSRVPFGANGRALTLADAVGFVQLHADTEDHRVLGAQGVGPNVAELALACGMAIEMEATLGDLSATIAAHPTLSESITDAASHALERHRSRRESAR